MSNLLSFAGSEGFRKTLIAKNLAPYQVPGGFTSSNGPQTYEVVLSDNTPVDTPNVYQDVFEEANDATKSNVYGQGIKVDIAELLNLNSGSVSMQQQGNSNLQLESNVQQQNYTTSDTKLELINEFFIDNNEVVNRFIPENGYQDLYVVTDNILPKNTPVGVYPKFQIGEFNLSDIITGDYNLSQDSYLQQISVQYLLDAFQVRIAREIEKNTIGRVNLDAFRDPFSVALLASGQEPLIYKNYTITVPDGIFDQAKFFLTKITGTYVPTSPIEGEYTSDPERQKTKVGQLIENVANRIYKPANPNNNPSIKFLNNTGSGQKSVLFTSLGYNRFKPAYEENKTQIGLVIDNLFNKDNSITNFYVGSETNEPSQVTSPVNLSPKDAYNNQTNTIVFGPDKLSQLYEGDQLDNYKFGLNGNAYTDEPRTDGGFTWTSLKNNQDAGKNVGRGGESFGTNNNFNSISSYFQSSESVNVEFKPGSILDETQRIIDSAPASGKERLQHVGNAMNQISKVFNDGYKELTKGSKVLKYVNKNGREVGEEYCRVFAKDRPYLTYGDLQATVANADGVETNGNIRKFSYSVLDSTYNLNIAPLKGQDSTNIRDNKVKKYMFSIENLAWRNTPEFTDLPYCEKGPNGGRIMWFPPYNLSLGQESSTPKFNATNFLGRPEPIYTYENTDRGSSISFDIVVDHPSVLNLIVKNELAKENGQTVNQVVASFFAGCKKYDIYELARKFNTISKSTIEELYQEVLQSNQTTNEDKKAAFNGLANGGQSPQVSEENTEFPFDYTNLGFYFDEYSPTQGTIPYNVLLDGYLNEKGEYLNQNEQSETETIQINQFFDIIDENYASIQNLLLNISTTLNNNQGVVTIYLNGTKPPQTVSSPNDWFESVKLYILNFQLPESNNITLQNFYEKNKLFIKQEDLGTVQNAEIKSSTPIDTINCGVLPVDEFGNTADKKYSLTAAACRAVRIKKITLEPNTPQGQTDGNTDNNNIPNQQSLNGIKPQQQIDLTTKSKGISKRILRELLTECNYFEMVKSTDPIIYDSFKNKIKYFNPAFHAITPEGLNSRLTFLQQCARPGRTIAVNQGNGQESIINDSFNTNFGTPPILVLRIGDFYHTKIVPNSLTIQYENLFDLNPEGIGVQPMIAKVTLGFSMIGGHGLKEPVERLQNALSFNYYANTEVYDERAEATEDTTAVDNALLSAINNEEPIITVNNVGSTTINDGGNTIGNILSASTSTGGVQNGTIEYKTFFNSFVGQTQDYFNGITESLKNISSEFNLGVLQQINTEKKYYLGSTVTNSGSTMTRIFGKPIKWEYYLQQVANQFIEDIDNDDEKIIDILKTPGNSSQTVTNSNINKIKNNYKNFINTYVNNEFTSIATSIQTTTETQVNYIQNTRKMDFISMSGDGKVLNDGTPKIYVLSGTTENGNDTFNDFQTDYSNIVNSLNSYYNYLNGTLIYTVTQSTIFSAITANMIAKTETEKRAYILLSKVILDENSRTNFVDELIKNITDETQKNYAKEQITLYVNNSYYNLFSDEKTAETTKVDNLISNESYQQYAQFNPQINGVSLTDKERVMSFVTSGGTDFQKTELKDIYATVNSNNDDMFNGKKQFNG